MTTPPTPKAAPHDEEAAAVWAALLPSQRSTLMSAAHDEVGAGETASLREMGLVERRGLTIWYRATPLGHRVAAYGRSQTR